MRGRMLVALGLGLGVVLGGLVVSLLQSDARLVGGNGRGLGSGAVVPPGKQLCQGNERVPRNVGSLRLVVSTAGVRAGPLEVSVFEPRGERVATGRTTSRFRDQPVSVPFARIGAGVEGATVCVRNAGGVQVAFLGDRYDLPPDRTDAAIVQDIREPTDRLPVQVPGRPAPGAALVRLEWLEPKTSSWLSFAPTIAERFGLVKASFMGTWTLWAVLALVLVTWALAIGTALRAAIRGGA